MGLGDQNFHYLYTKTTPLMFSFCWIYPLGLVMKDKIFAMNGYMPPQLLAFNQTQTYTFISVAKTSIFHSPNN